MLLKLWWGQYPLIVSFWRFFIGGWLLLVFGLAITSYLIRLHLEPRFPGPAIGAAVLFAYHCFAAVGVWRSADNHPETRYWGYAAKFVIIVIIGRILFGLVNGGPANWIGAILG
jgi:uncharacterized membrane protein YdjX (TVP38/TMEM64 family)